MRRFTALVVDAELLNRKIHITIYLKAARDVFFPYHDIKLRQSEFAFQRVSCT